MTNITLSFCIPTYNRCFGVTQLVKQILTSELDDIEVVVLDNGSTDGTVRALGEITDDRLSIYSNETNKGALFNMINVLDKGRGAYLVYCIDKDHVYPEEIKDFKKFLKSHPDVFSGFCECSNQKKDFDLYTKGFDSINKVAYLGRHPTGYFFKNEHYKALKVLERFSDYNVVDLFPLEFALAELGTKGGSSIYYKKLFMPEMRKNMVQQQKSSTTTGLGQTAYFFPESRLKVSLSYAKHIESLSIERCHKDHLQLKTFFGGLWNATIGYRNILRNETLCIHYHMQRRDLTLWELIALAKNYYNNYVAGSYNNNVNFNKMQFNLRIFRYVLKRTSAKIGQKMGTVLTSQ